MTEGTWHEKARNKLIKKYRQNGYEVNSSHMGQKLFLFKDYLRRENILSDVDLAILKDDKIMELVEIQQSLRPKEIIGIIATTNLCDKCNINGREYAISEATIKIIVKKQKEKSRKKGQLELIKNNLKLQKGCLKSFQFEEYD